MDNLPAAATGLLEDGSVLYARGIPIGGKEKDTGNYFVYNHAKMTVHYHEDPAYEGARVVGFEVWPLSVQQDAAVDPKCDKEHAQKSTGMPVDELPHMIIKGSTLKDGELPKVLYSYDVFWAPSPIQWASRWDIYLSMGDLYSNKVRFWAGALLLRSLLACGAAWSGSSALTTAHPSPRDAARSTGSRSSTRSSSRPS